MRERTENQPIDEYIHKLLHDYWMLYGTRGIPDYILLGMAECRELWTIQATNRCRLYEEKQEGSKLIYCIGPKETVLIASPAKSLFLPGWIDHQMASRVHYKKIGMETP